MYLKYIRFIGGIALVFCFQMHLIHGEVYPQPSLLNQNSDSSLNEVLKKYITGFYYQMIPTDENWAVPQIPTRFVMAKNSWIHPILSLIVLHNVFVVGLVLWHKVLQSSSRLAFGMPHHF